MCNNDVKLQEVTSTEQTLEQELVEVLETIDFDELEIALEKLSLD